MSITRILTLQPLPARPQDGHKGTFGRLLVVGGQPEMFGAPVFAGTSALRMGSGLVQVATLTSILANCLQITPELIGLGIRKRESNKRLLSAAEQADAVVLGPGLGVSRYSEKWVNALIGIAKPMVLDADALNILSMAKRWPKHFYPTAVLTPHPGEMRRLCQLFGRADLGNDEEDRIQCAIEAATAFKQIIILKGHRTVVTDGKNLYINRTGDNTLAKAGTGDVLSGVIGSLLGQKMNAFDAACTGVWLHGKAGELAGQQIGQRSALARDVIDQISKSIDEYTTVFGSS